MYLHEQVDTVVEAIRDYVKALIHEQTDDDPDSLGSYREEQTLREELLKLMGGKRS
jgi:hypothetical protein